jgi:RHS repeat-associated protein
MTEFQTVKTGFMSKFQKVVRSAIAVCVVVAGVAITVLNVPHAGAATTYTEYAGNNANTWTDYLDAGGTAGPQVPGHVPIQITCALPGFRVADGNTWWYEIASSPWNNNYYVSADAFYNNGETSGSLLGTPFVDPAVPTCGSGGVKNETTGSTANTWTNYSDAGGTEGPTIPDNATVSISCAVQGFRVADGNTWWYEIASSPWNNSYYVSADAFYNNGATSGSLVGTPFVDPAIPICTSVSNPPPPGGTGETTGSVAHTWTDFADAGGTQGPSISSNQTVSIACKVTGFAVADGNTWWYEIGSAPWSDAYYVSADAFYNDGATSGSLLGTPFVDPSVPTCATASSSHPAWETAGSAAQTWANYSHAGAAEGPTIPSNTTVSVSCRVTGFRVADGNTWWYLVSSAPWDDVYYVSADAFYNNGSTSGSLLGTPFVDTSVPNCSGNLEEPIYSSAYGSASAVSQSNACHHADPVNCASGDFWQTFTDVSISGRGPGLNLARTYNDLSASSQGMFGNGWSSSYDQHLTLGGKDGSILIILADGSQMVAEPNGSGGFMLPPSTNDAFVANSDGTYTLTEGATQFLTFSTTGLLLSIADLNGYQTTLAYNGSNQLVSVTDSAGRALEINHGANGLVSSVVDPMGRTTTYSYDPSGDLISVTDPMGRLTSFTYNGSFQMLTMTDPRGGTVHNTYDADGRVLTQTDPTGRATAFSYVGDNFSSLGGAVTITDPNGNVEVEKYTNGFETQVIKAYGTPEQATWTYTYDPNTYEIASVTDPNGNVTTHTYDGNGNLLSTTDPLHRTTTYTYNALNEVVSTTTPLTEITSHTYDANGNLLTTTNPLQGVTTYTYGNPGEPGDMTSETDPAGGVTDYSYDTDGDQVSKTTNPSPGVTDTTSYSFNADGEQVCEASANATASSVSCPPAGAARVAGTTTSTYDADGEPTSVTDPLGNTTLTVYDADGNKVQVTDPEGHVTSYTFDADDELVGTEQANGGTTATAYDDDGNVISTTDADGHVTSYTYDPLNQLVSTKDSLGETTTYTYDPDGNRLTTTDPSGRVTTDAYDADNELVLVGYSDGTTHSVAYTYNADGKRTSMTDGTGATSYSYDALQRLVSSTDGAGSVTVYSYDGDGHLTSIIYPNNRTVSYTYDGAGRDVSVTDWLGNRTVFTYDHDGNELTASALAVKRGSSYAATTETYTYNADDQVLSIVDRAGTKVVESFTYSRNSDSQVSSVTPSSKNTESYSYDSMEQLIGDSSGAYSYDSAGNLTESLKTTPLAYNAADELVSSGSKKRITTYTYDAEGQRTAETPPKGSDTRYTYDQAGRLIGLSTGSMSAVYSYNGDGLRMSKTVGSNATAQFTWNIAASTPLLLSDGTNSYIYGPNNLPLESISSAGDVEYYHHDQLGSTTLLTSASGAKVATYTYDSYGLITKHTGAAINPLLYAGQYQDSESGFYYLQARYYDPTTGQFVTVDPIVDQTDLPYGYAAGDPINESDPSGEFPWGAIVSTVIDHNPVVSLIQGGVTALGGYASATGTCFAYGWGSNECSDATWNATIGALEFGLSTLTGGVLGTVVGIAEDLYNANSWEPYSLGSSSGAPNGYSGSSRTPTQNRGSSSGPTQC